MRRQPPKGRGTPPRAPTGGSPGEPGAHGPLERAEALWQRLEAGGPNLARAAEELDRLQAALERAGALPELRRRAEALCRRWAAEPAALRGERARAWLTLVGAFRMAGHAARAAQLAAAPGLPSEARIQACRVLAALAGDAPTQALLEVLRSRTELAVRVAAAEALGERGDRAARSALEGLLEEDLPRPVWQAVAAALERL